MACIANLCCNTYNGLGMNLWLHLQYSCLSALQKYYDLYAVDKKRYDRQMQEYVAKGQRQQFAKLLLDSLTGTESEKSTDHK